MSFHAKIHRKIFRQFLQTKNLKKKFSQSFIKTCSKKKIKANFYANTNLKKN